MEGPPEKRRTFRKNSPWHGRSPGKAQDLPEKRPLAWKVPRKSAGPSGKTTPSPEGPLDGEGERAVHPRKSPFWWMAKARGGTGRHEATCHPRLGGACEAMALRRESRRGSPVLPWLAGSNKSSPVQQGQTRATRAGGRRRAGGVSRCSTRGCQPGGDGCRPSGSGCSSRPCAKRNTRSCRRSRDAGPAGTGSRIACWRG